MTRDKAQREIVAELEAARVHVDSALVPADRGCWLSGQEVGVLVKVLVELTSVARAVEGRRAVGSG